jgi:hypothetical protein
MEAMDNISRPQMGIFMSVVASCGSVAVGLANIASGLEWYEVGDIVAGVGFCLLPCYFLYASSASSSWHKKRIRLVATAAVMAAAFVILGDVARISGINPVKWLVGGSHVAPSTLIQHPFIYNHQQVETDGFVARNDRGWCVLEEGAASEPQANVIALSFKGLGCKPDLPQRGWESVSGTFRVYKTSKGFDIPYALMNAQSIPSGSR